MGISKRGYQENGSYEIILCLSTISEISMKTSGDQTATDPRMQCVFLFFPAE